MNYGWFADISDERQPGLVSLSVFAILGAPALCLLIFALMLLAVAVVLAVPPLLLAWLLAPHK